MNTLKVSRLLFVLFIFIMAGCTKASRPEPVSLQPVTLSELYPGDIAAVNAIEIRNGSNGELKAYDNQEQITQWLQEVSGLILTPDPNQEGTVGFLYSVALLENGAAKLRFTSTHIGDIYYLPNDELASKIELLYRSSPK